METTILFGFRVQGQGGVLGRLIPGGDQGNYVAGPKP